MFHIVMTECSICCERTDAKLPCWTCTGEEKAYCESCFAKIASINNKSYNMEIRCPFCRTKMEIHLSHNNTILIIQKGVLMCSITNDNNLNRYIRRAYRRFAERRNPSEQQMEHIIATLIPYEQRHERYLFKNFILQTSIQTSSEKQKITALELPLIPIDDLHTTWKKKRGVLEYLKSELEKV